MPLAGYCTGTCTVLPLGTTSSITSILEHTFGFWYGIRNAVTTTSTADASRAGRHRQDGTTECSNARRHHRGLDRGVARGVARTDQAAADPLGITERRAEGPHESSTAGESDGV